ncbi:TenA family protein [Maritimibacter sp. DP1N21-5]|uniref:TenA family protein n=1 Tax=Maritimibacter sp. DP1N21-5 TaxID=2836867 RepID=UPI001C4613B4|nr:TenA family protein [Maritimibacter sp. DP1N21-5]MBV7407400.1 TenA family protein [Maritimibacter sp. DP1N21-5]
MRPTDLLKSGAEADWTAATDHPFTRALAEGTLPPEKMAGYLQQDFLFIDGFVRLLASAIARAPSLADSVPAAQFLAVVAGPENTYFLRSFDALGVSPDARPAPVTRAFQDLMAEARETGRYECMLAVLVVAEWSYLDWATPFSERAASLPFWHGEWITLHTGEGFAGVVAYLRDQLDRIWPGLSPDEQARAEALFHRAVALERDFFDAAWAGFGVAR